MKILSCILALLAVSLFAFDALAQTDPAQTLPIVPAKAESKTATPRAYTLVPGDEIEIKVLTEDQFSGKYTIDPEGKIQLAFIEQPLQVGCRTENEARDLIGKSLGKYLKKPNFTMQITKRSPPAMVYGEVRIPGKVEMPRRVRLFEILSFSGGWTEKAAGIVQIFHTQQAQCFEPGEESEPQPTVDGLDMPFKVYKLSDISAAKNEANPIIRPGDVIEVKKAPPIYIVGELRAIPGEPITIPEGGLMLTEAVARSGGLSREAKKKDVRIYRLKPGSKDREIISVNLDEIKKQRQKDVALQPYDVIEVEKAPKSITDILRETVLKSVDVVSYQLPIRILY